MLRINISHIIRDNHKQCAGKPQCEDGTNGSFWITRYICHCHRKHGDIFSAISFSFFCVSAFSKYRVASIGEILETIFIDLRSAKATVRNDTKIQRSITGRENSGTC